MHTHWAHVGRGAAGLGAAMGIGRFAYTPILPLMTTQAALTPQAAGALATANYVGYLAGALAGTASPRLARSTVAWRVSLVSVLFVSYTLEGVGYIIAGTFLVAAIKQNSSGWLGNGAWLFAGLAAAPSAAGAGWMRDGRNACSDSPAPSPC